MYWKLRIPLILGVIGVVSGLVQKFPNLFLVNSSYLISSALFIGLIGIIFTILEKTDLNERKVHFTIGVGIILFGYTFDYLMA
ncbi:hypothetical protein SAMN05216565_103179 [Litchfieldia salsa]|uniref:Uncharacterized protein n=1 Tax=Litchfieldia salsa TaxID=930152 RepID=A0A1H0SYI8_9BACI|nr:hypothetical protein SAMN05216565_103179 [Litchfieldia salsa]